jgi:hypothetical protein
MHCEPGHSVRKIIFQDPTDPPSCSAPLNNFSLSTIAPIKMYTLWQIISAKLHLYYIMVTLTSSLCLSQTLVTRSLHPSMLLSWMASFDPTFVAAMVARFYDRQDNTTGRNFVCHLCILSMPPRAHGVPKQLYPRPTLTFINNLHLSQPYLEAPLYGY